MSDTQPTETFHFIDATGNVVDSVTCTEDTVWSVWCRKTYPTAVRFTDAAGSVMAIADTD